MLRYPPNWPILAVCPQVQAQLPGLWVVPHWQLWRKLVLEQQRLWEVAEEAVSRQRNEERLDQSAEQGRTHIACRRATSLGYITRWPLETRNTSRFGNVSALIDEEEKCRKAFK